MLPRNFAMAGANYIFPSEMLHKQFPAIVYDPNFTANNYHVLHVTLNLTLN